MQTTPFVDDDGNVVGKSPSKQYIPIVTTAVQSTTDNAVRAIERLNPARDHSKLLTSTDLTRLCDLMDAFPAAHNVQDAALMVLGVRAWKNAGNAAVITANPDGVLHRLYRVMDTMIVSIDMQTRACWVLHHIVKASSAEANAMLVSTGAIGRVNNATAAFPSLGKVTLHFYADVVRKALRPDLYDKKPCAIM